MIVGIPRETKPHEYRVGTTPEGVRELTGSGHRVIVEKEAGVGCGIDDHSYVDAGAEVVDTAAIVFEECELIVKVKEPQPDELPLLRSGQTLFTYLHLAADRALTEALLKQDVRAIAYETVATDDGRLPLLAPMSEIAGRMAPQEAAAALKCSNGGRGVLLPGAPGVPVARVVVIGAGSVGVNAARVAAGMGADVTVLDRNIDRLRALTEGSRGDTIRTVMSSVGAVEQALDGSDVVIGAVLVPGRRAPHVVTRDMLALLPRGAVLVDVSIDQGGCFETSRATTHEEPTYVVDGIVHYGVANMPGAVPRTATYALANATLPYLLTLAELGVLQAVRADRVLARGVSTWDGHLTCAASASSLQLPHHSLEVVMDGP